ncbi:MAG: PEPxxWA-CTERM sorting domain-containing protein [Thermaurantiacus sp.]
MRISTIATAAALALAPATAMAAPLAGVETRVLFGELPEGLTAGLIGTASLVPSDGLFVSFPVTGGVLDGAATVVFHDGSGVTLSDGMATVGLSDFRIELGPELVFGNVSLNGDPFAGNVPLFTGPFLANLADLFLIDAPVVPLLLTAEAVGALNTVFGTNLPELAQIGTVATNLAVVPEPATWGMLIVGFGAVGFALRKRQTPAVATA